MRSYVLLLFVPLLTAAPRPEAVLAKARAALGNVESVRSLSLKGTRYVTTDSPDGTMRMTREVEIDYLLPDKFLRAETMELPDGAAGPTILDALNAAGSWRDVRNTPQEGNVVVHTLPPPGVDREGPAAEQARTKLARHSFLRNILLYTLTPPPGVNVQFGSVSEGETKNGKAWILPVSGPDDFQVNLLIDQQSNLPVLLTWRGLMGPRPMIRQSFAHGDSDAADAADVPAPPKPQEVEFQLSLSGHTAFGALQMPKRMVLTASGKPMDEFELKSALINPALDPNRFQKR